MQREFKSLMKQANEMRKLPPKTVIVFPSFDEHEQMLNEAKQGIPMPDVPTRQQSRSEKSRLTAGGMTMGLVASPLTGMGTLHAMKKYLPNASPRLFAGLGATSLVAPVVAGTAAGHAIGKHRFDKQEAIRKAYEDQVKERYGDIELKRFTDMLDAQIAQRKQASVEFEGLRKQATEMTKLAGSMQKQANDDIDDTDDSTWDDDLQKIEPIAERYRKLYYSDDFNQAQEAYQRKVKEAEQNTPFVAPKMTFAEGAKQYGYPALGVGAGLLGSYGILRGANKIMPKNQFGKDLVSMGASGLSILSPVVGWAGGMMHNDSGYDDRVSKAKSNHESQIHKLLSGTPEGQRFHDAEINQMDVEDEYYDHPEVAKFRDKYMWQPQLWD